MSAAAYARAPGLTPGGQSALQRLADTKFAEAEPRLVANAPIDAEIAAADLPFQMPFEERGGELVPFYRRPGGLADQRALDEYIAGKRDAAGRAAPPMGTYPSAPPEIRPEAADLMTAEERAQFIAELQARRGPSPMDVARATTFAPPQSLPPIQRPQMVPPAMIADSVGTVRVPSGVTPPSVMPSTGRYAPGPVPTAPPPAQAVARPGLERTGPIGMDLRRMPAKPEDTTEFLTMMREGKSPATQRAEDAAAAGKKVSDIKVAGAEEAFGGGKKGIDPKLDYLFKRVEAATSLSKRDDKLRRLTSSGAGKTAQELYDRNLRDVVPFTVTYAKITEIFKNDRDGMMKAHEVALALDIKADNKEPQ